MRPHTTGTRNVWNIPHGSEGDRDAPAPAADATSMDWDSWGRLAGMTLPNNNHNYI